MSMRARTCPPARNPTFILQDESKTLNDKAIDAIMQKLIQNLTKQLGAELR